MIRFLSRRRLTGILAFGLTALILTSVVNATAASNNVAVSSLEDFQKAMAVDDRKPEECDGITLAGGSVSPNSFNGNNTSELLLGGPGNQTIDGNAGDDCIVAGGGADTLRGNTGNDVILAGPGNDLNISGGGGTDICYGGEGNDTFNADCETRIQ